VLSRLISLSIFSSSGSCFFDTPSRANVRGTVLKYLKMVTCFEAAFE
jgi:hypothetical protein